MYYEQVISVKNQKKLRRKTIHQIVPPIQIIDKMLNIIRLIIKYLCIMTIVNGAKSLIMKL